MVDKSREVTVYPQAGWRLPPELLRLVRLDAVERGMRYSEVVRERLEESFGVRPVGVEPSPFRSS